MKPFKVRFLALTVLVSALSGINVWAASDLSTLNVFPNPVRVFNGETTVTFDNLTAQVKIVVLDLNSHLVFEKDLDASGSQYLWDMTNNSGEKVASGIYYYFVANNNGEKRRGKLAIIR